MSLTWDPFAVAIMVAYCGWDPTEPVSNQPVTLDGNGLQMLALPSLYVTGVSSVVASCGDGTVFTYLSTDSPASIGPGNTLVGWSENGTLFNADPESSGVWPTGQGNVTVTYSGGYTVVPPELQAVLNSLTTRMPQMQTGLLEKRMGLASFKYTPAAAGGLLMVEQMILDRFRIFKAA